MRDAGLDLGLWIDRFDGLGEAAQAVDDSDEDVINAPLPEQGICITVSPGCCWKDDGLSTIALLCK